MSAGKITGCSGYNDKQFSLFSIDDPNVVVWALKPAEEGIEKGMILRAWNLADINTPINILSRSYIKKRVSGASQRYVDLALKTMEPVYVEVNPGDALFFHGNLSHRSEANLSASSRWSIISCYNRQSNRPYQKKSIMCHPIGSGFRRCFAQLGNKRITRGGSIS